MGGAFIGAGKAAFHLRDALRKNDDSVNELKTESTIMCHDELHDTSVLDWRWLVLRCERRFLAQATRRRKSKAVSEVLVENFDINQFACFVPRTVLEAIADKRIHYMREFEVIIERFNAAVVFCDASGFTSLCEALDKEPNGAEKLGESLNSFFSPLIRIVDFWGGDIIKFSGDAVTIVWPVDDESAQSDSKCSSLLENCFYVNKVRACQLACQCCLELHKNLSYFPTPIYGMFFTLHITVAYGEVTILQLGGISQRWEYVVAGPPMKEIAIGEPLADSGKTVISPSVIDVLCNRDFEPLDSNPLYAKLNSWDEHVKAPPQLEKIKLGDCDIELLRRFIPSTIFKRLAAGYNAFINEIRKVSVVFIGINGLDVSTDQGSQLAQRLMQLAQRAAYTMEGSVNKFLVDDKGVLVLIMFGLPPVFHLDDPSRAVLTALRIADGLKLLSLRAKIGIATGRVWCGTIGCEIRKEYTALGDTVNLAARLMSSSDNNMIFCDIETKNSCEHVLEFKVLPSLYVKGKFNKVTVFRPTGRMHSAEEKIQLKNPIESWSFWKYKDAVNQLFDTCNEYRHPILNVDFPPLDYETETGPLMPWEYIDPLLPSLKSWINTGGIAVIIGKESEGTQELLTYISKLSKNLSRSIFCCSSMPDEKNLNIANVPLLVWRNVCSEMIFKWKHSPIRESKGFAKFGKDNSTFSLLKELVHPSFHWRLYELKSVVSDLEIPQKFSENCEMRVLPYLDQSGNQRILWPNRSRRSQEGSTKLLKINPFTPLKLKFDNDRSVAPLITSLVNGYAMYESTVLCLHVRTGTSLFNTMDSESWKTAKLAGRIAMTRRWHKLEYEMMALKSWRRRHSRQCFCCKNTKIADLVTSQKSNSWALCSNPPKSKYFPPFLYIVACNEVSENNLEQQELINWAKECNAFIQMERLNYAEVDEYIAHCLSTLSKAVPLKLLHYIYRVTGGVNQYIFWTIKRCLAERAIIVIDNYCKTDEQLLMASFNNSANNSSHIANVKLLSRLLCPFSNVQPKSLCMMSNFARNNNIKPLKCMRNHSNTVTVYNFKCQYESAVNYNSNSTETSHSESGIQSYKIDSLQIYPVSSMKKFGDFLGKEAKSSEPLHSVQLLTDGQLNDLKNIQVRTLKQNECEISQVTESQIRAVVKNTDSKNSTNKQILLLKDLSSVTFVPEMEAAAMFLLEKLDPDAQVLTKLASLFPSTFTAFELQIAYPKKVSYMRFETILAQLVKKEMFEKLCVSAQNHIDYLTVNNNFHIHYLAHYTKVPLVVYRFTSAVYQEVVRGNLVSQEKKELSSVANKTFLKRFKV